jgi:AbrB family looped-hinge helix DNA binding protein
LVSVSTEVRIGKRRTLVIPKNIAEKLGIKEGDKIKITVVGDKLVLQPIRDAVWLSLYRKKVAKVTLEDLEATSIEEQDKDVQGLIDTSLLLLVVGVYVEGRRTLNYNKTLTLSGFRKYFIQLN